MTPQFPSPTSYYRFINPSTRPYFDWSNWYGRIGIAEPGQQTQYSTLLRWADGSYMRFPLAIEDRNSFVKVGSPADDRGSECPAAIERDDSCSVYEECPAYIERDDSCPVYKECTAYAEKEHSALAYTLDSRVYNGGSYIERNLNARRSKKGSMLRRIFTVMLSQIKGWACCGSTAEYEIPEVTSGDGRRGALLKY